MPVDSDRLDSWKQIAAYLGRSQRTVRRWNETEGLPVHKHPHQERGTVWAYRSEIDGWLQRRKISPVTLAEAEPTELSLRAENALSGKSTTVGVVLAMVIGTYWVSLKSPATSSPTLSDPVGMTSLPGREGGPSFSPDGKQVVFFWDGFGPMPAGIYLKTIGTDNVTLLTPGNDDFAYGPVWSPDGRTIAFLRRTTDQKTWLCLIAPSGGPEKRLIRLHDKSFLRGDNRHLNWSLDSMRILAPIQGGGGEYEWAISWIRLSDGAIERVTEPSDSARAPALSPDRRSLVFLRVHIGNPGGDTELLRQELKPDGSAEGAPRQLFRGPGLVSGIEWTPDGKDLVLCKAESGFTGPRLYRLPATPGGRLTPIIPMAACSTLAISPADENGRTALVYGRVLENRGQLWKAEMKDLERSTRFAPSSRSDQFPSFSPNGALVAFNSMRGGTEAVWVADHDGNEPRRVSDLPPLGGTIEWSPAGNQLLFASKRLGLALVPLMGGQPAIIAPDVVTTLPHWSHGSGFIYYLAAPWIFRLRPDGHDRAPQFKGESLLSPVGTAIRTSPDGKMIFLTKNKALFRRPAATDGVEERIEPNLLIPSIATTRTALYYVRREDTSLYALPFSGGPARKIGRWRSVENKGENLPSSFTVSPDDRTVVWSVGVSVETDLEMISDFPQTR